MLVVPIAKDTIKTKDGHTYKVVEYTNYKEAGPAVYAKSPTSKESVLVYFVDIEQINGTRVEYQRGSKVFSAFGRIKRSQHIPQPDDTVILSIDKISHEDEEKDQAEVDGLRLKSKALGINKGMFIKTTDGNHYRLKQIVDIIPDLGSHHFNRTEFLKIYKDYAGV